MKMFSTFVAVCSLLLTISFYKECRADCQDKPPVAGFKTSYMAGKFYCIALKAALQHQETETRCVEGTAINPQQKTFKYIVEKESDNGTISTINMTSKNLLPPGRLYVTLDDGSETWYSSALGGSSKYYSAYVCNKKTGTYGLWIYYYKRVQGLNGLDSDTLTQVKSLMAKNNLPMSDLREIDNNNCTN